jgi:hypothetical protein
MSLAMFIIYTLLPIAVELSSAAFLNINLLTSGIDLLHKIQANFHHKNKEKSKS